ncbi:MAG: dihydropteroate synthase [Epsilonproteobacteria bacterium]|nr:dihydropteroate synthase [Campylobacterota bacterium]
MQVYKLSSNIDIVSYMKQLNVSAGGIEIMSKKANLNFFLIKNIYCGASNILKQDALSINAELVVPMGSVDCKTRYHDAILICNDKQLEILIRKERHQPFELKKLSNHLLQFTTAKTYPIKIMGIINANDDSFFSASRFNDTNAIAAIEQMIADGAQIIDIGGVSSRPGSKHPGVAEELRRVEPIIRAIYAKGLYKKALFSIDSFSYEVVKLALDCGFGIVNDITGLSDENIARVAGEYGARVCIMHMQGNPENMQNNPFYDDVIAQVDEFFARRIEVALKHNVNDIILDVGIGFGKRLEDNITLIKHLEHFTHYGYELLVGASRKSMIDMIIPTPIEERLPATLAIHLEAIRNKASIIRCHDVKEHKQAIEVFKRLY